MKDKSFEVLCDIEIDKNGSIRRISHISFGVFDETSVKTIKGKIVYDIPESTVTISESEFDKACSEAIAPTAWDPRWTKSLKEKIFGRGVSK